jgi:hypothetical protein
LYSGTHGWVGFTRQRLGRLRFGVGGAALVDRVVVRFPNGQVKTWQKIKTNQTLNAERKDN